MSYDRLHDDSLTRLQARVHGASAISSDLVAAVIAGACPRVQVQPRHAHERLTRLIASGAWIDALVALIELELPQWTIRRLVHEDRAWHCSLSKQPGLPVELDDMAEAVHETLPLAVLGALLEARRMNLAASETRSSAVPLVRPAGGVAVCCDNFA